MLKISLIKSNQPQVTRTICICELEYLILTTKYILGFQPESLLTYHQLQDFVGHENRRLLPDSSNAIHILDGPSSRYYFGIIDIFTSYGPRRRLNGFLKTLFYCSTNHSTVDPDTYATRLVQFIEDHLDESGIDQA